MAKKPEDVDSDDDSSYEECPFYSTKKKNVNNMFVANKFGEDWPEYISQNSDKISDTNKKEKEKENDEVDLRILEKMREQLMRSLRHTDKEESNAEKCDKNTRDFQLNHTDAIPSTSKVSFNPFF